MVGGPCFTAPSCVGNWRHSLGHFLVQLHAGMTTDEAISSARLETVAVEQGNQSPSPYNLSLAGSRALKPFLRRTRTCRMCGHVYGFVFFWFVPCADVLMQYTALCVECQAPGSANLHGEFDALGSLDSHTFGLGCCRHTTHAAMQGLRPDLPVGPDMLASEFGAVQVS